LRIEEVIGSSLPRISDHFTLPFSYLLRSAFCISHKGMSPATGQNPNCPQSSKFVYSLCATISLRHRSVRAQLGRSLSRFEIGFTFFLPTLLSRNALIILWQFRLLTVGAAIGRLLGGFAIPPKLFAEGPFLLGSGATRSRICCDWRSLRPPLLTAGTAKNAVWLLPAGTKPTASERIVDNFLANPDSKTLRIVIKSYLTCSPKSTSKPTLSKAVVPNHAFQRNVQLLEPD